MVKNGNGKVISYRLDDVVKRMDVMIGKQDQHTEAINSLKVSMESEKVRVDGLEKRVELQSKMVLASLFTGLGGAANSVFGVLKGGV